MNLIQLIACAGLITGCFVLLRISPMDFTEGVFRRITSKPKSIRAEVNEMLNHRLLCLCLKGLFFRHHCCYIRIAD